LRVAKTVANSRSDEHQFFSRACNQWIETGSTMRRALFPSPCEERLSPSVSPPSRSPGPDAARLTKPRSEVRSTAQATTPAPRVAADRDRRAGRHPAVRAEADRAVAAPRAGVGRAADREAAPGVGADREAGADPAAGRGAGVDPEAGRGADRGAEADPGPEAGVDPEAAAAPARGAAPVAAGRARRRGRRSTRAISPAAPSASAAPRVTAR